MILAYSIVDQIYMVEVNIAGLRSQLEIFLERRIYKGLDHKFKIQSLGTSHLGHNLFYLTPEGAEELIPRNQQDFDWENDLFNIGRTYGVSLALNPTCYKDRQ